MSVRAGKYRASFVVYGLIAAAGMAALFGPTVSGQEAKAGAKEDPNAACMSCHAEEMEGRPSVHLDKLKISQHKDLRCQDCHSAITGPGPHPAAQLKEKAACATCHADEAAAYAKGVHSRPDKVKGDHPNCITCHANGDPHAVVKFSTWTAVQKVERCSLCHEDKARMDRYGVNPDAGASYWESFHGKALMRFGMKNAASCKDCHGTHGVLPPSDPRAPTFRTNAAATCGKCHPGAKMNFAMSGANHVRLKVDESPVLRWELLFFRILIFCVVAFLAMGVVLDLRKKVFSRGAHPKSGRLVASFIGVSFLSMVVTLVLATLQRPGAIWTWLVALAALAVALIIYKLQPKPARPHVTEKRYQHWPMVYRIQHGLMALSFTTLAATGLPMRFAPDNKWLSLAYLPVGGFHNARMIHRGAAMILIIVWLWHLLYLFIRWAQQGFSFKGWNMFPSKKDLEDFIGLSKYYVGLAPTEPKYGRFSFKNKLDYLAEYWGMPLMVVTGFILWFPVYWSLRLPEGALSFAYIAHSYEATLAFLSIITWHMYNAHFSPDEFPMNDVFLTGTMTREEMLHAHPLELERLDAEEAESAGATPDKPAGGSAGETTDEGGPAPKP